VTPHIDKKTLGAYTTSKCWVCVILFSRISAPEKKEFPRETCHLFCLVFCVAPIFVSIVGRFFGTWFITNGFIFLVKKLGLLTNPSHWVRVFNVWLLYVYCIVNNV
jgi:hypothetical protein